MHPIKKLRLKNKLNQHQMAAVLGVTQSCLSKIETGALGMSVSGVCKINKKFKVGIAQFVNRVFLYERQK